MTSALKESQLATKKNLAHPKYRADIDGLRAIAVLAVVAFHAFPFQIRGGFIGVDVFFVISGFLISSIIFESLKNNSFSFSEFYIKRINRIFPALLIVLTCCFLFGTACLFQDELKQLGKHLFGAASFTSNIFLWDESGYFDTSTDYKPLLHLWSLGIEEQFYLLWPLAAWVAWRARKKYLTLLITMWAISFSLNIFFVYRDPSMTFYMLPTRMWELLSGAILSYYAYNKTYTDSNKTNLLNRQHSKNIAGIFGFILITAGSLILTKDQVFPGWLALIPVIGACLLIAAGPTSLVNKKILSSRILVWFGLISFPLYLWHWPLLSFAKILENDIPSRWIRLSLIALSILLAWATYKFVESPIRKRGAKKTALFLTLIMFTVGATGLSTFASNGFSGAGSSNSGQLAQSQLVGPIWKFTNNEQCLNRYPFEDSKKYGWWFCMTNRDAQPNIILYGNSFANHLYPGLASNDRLSNNTILSIGTCTIGTAESANKDPDTGLGPCVGNRSNAQEDLILKILKNNEKLTYVIIDGLPKDPNNEYISNVEKGIEKLLKPNVKIIIFTPHLTFDYDIRGCFPRLSKNSKNDNCTVSTLRRDSLTKSFQPLVERISTKHPEILFFDQNDLMCNKTSCSMILNGMPLFRDQSNHYSEFASKKLSVIFSEWAKNNAPDLITN